jgi:hypothetical protein
MTTRFSLTPRFIEVLAGEALTYNCFNSFGSPDEPLKRFRREDSAPDTQLKSGVNERTIPPND